MTQPIIRRLGLSALFAVLALVLLASSPDTSSAHRRSGARGRKSAHSASHHGVSHKGARKHYAKLSKKHHAPQRTLTASEKEEMVEKIKSLATSTMVDSGEVVASEAQNLDIQAEIAQAAKEEQEEDVDVSIEQFFRARPGATGGSADAASIDPNVNRSRQEDFTLFDESDPATAASRSDIMAQIIDWIGTRYHFGGADRTGIDCSAFTQTVFQKAFGVSLPRTAYMQYQLGDGVGKTQLQFGDLVFFKTARYSPVTHVGIYIGEGLFANAACSKGVSVASLESPYWSKRYIGAKRLFTNSATASRDIQKELDNLAASGIADAQEGD